MDGGGSDLLDNSSLSSIFDDKPTADIHPSPGCVHLAIHLVFEVQTLNIIICPLNIACCDLFPFPCSPADFETHISLLSSAHFIFLREGV